jgi:predicted peroxiredoxin
MGKIMINNTCGKEAVERASLAFVVGKTALNSGQEATVLLTIEGVRVATKGYSEELQAHGFDPLSKLVSDFITMGGRVWLCGACAKPRNITDADLVPGAQIVGAASAVELMVSGAQTLSF